MEFKVPPALSLEQHPKRTFLLLSGIIVFSLYWQSFKSPFLYDDLDEVVNNPNLAAWSAFVQRFLLHPVALTTSFLGYGGSTYRPLFWLSLFVDRAVWGLAPGGFHATNIVFHLLNGNLLFALLRRLKQPALLAAAASLLWLSLPIDTEVVAWVSGRAYLLCATFVLLALLSSLTYLRRGGLFFGVAYFATSGCAILSHELGIVVLPLLIVIAVVTGTAWNQRLFGAVGLTLLASLGVEALRLILGVRGFSGGFSPRWTALALWQYVALTLLPVHMSVERSTTIALNQTHPLLLVELLTLAGIVGYAMYRRQSNPAFLAGLSWFGLCIAPFCLVMNYQGIAERFVYLAAIGLITVLAAMCFAASHPSVRRALFACLAFWFLWNLCRTFARVADWSDPVQLYQSSLEATPLSPSVHYNLAFSLRERGALQDALKEYQKVIDLSPAYPHGFAGLGNAYLSLNQYDRAQAAYKQALMQNSKDTDVLLNSGVAFQRAGQQTAAEVTYLRILQIDPADSPAHVNLGVLYQGESRLGEASRQFSAAIDLKTKDIVPYYDLGVILQQAGRPDLALLLYKKVLEIKPDDEDTLRNVQMLQQQDK